MLVSKKIDKIIEQCVYKMNTLVPSKKKINPNKFDIQKSKIFDSLNYLILMTELDNRISQNFKKNLNLISCKPFKNSNEIKKHLKKKLK